jgi:cell division protein FtsB
MKNINIRKWYYHIRHRYMTMNNVVIAIAFIIGASWTWGSVGMMQRNYALQKEVDGKKRTQQLADLEVQTLTYEQNYYKSSEYQDLAMRQRLGMVDAGEKALILPPNTAVAKNADRALTDKKVRLVVPESNFQQWANFLFGANRSDT